jgi:hypothetical protein
MTTGNAQVVQAAGDLHYPIRNALDREVQDIFDNPTAFDPRNHAPWICAAIDDRAVSWNLPRRSHDPLGGCDPHRVEAAIRRAGGVSRAANIIELAMSTGKAVLAQTSNRGIFPRWLT